MPPRHLAELLDWQARHVGPAVAVRFRRHGLYCDWTWAEYHNEVRAAAAALIHAGVEPGDRIGLLAENCREWLAADMAILSAGGVNVPPHAPLPARQVLFQLQDAGVSWLFVSTAEQLAKARSIRGELPNLRGIVVFDARAADKEAPSWRGFVQRGRALLPQVQGELERRSQRLGPDDLATIMYTSGTTGNPKGVMLSHGNLVSNAVACDQAARRGPVSVLFNWLPFSHIYARTVDHYLSLATGATLCLAQNQDTLVPDLMAVQPTHLSSVPRFYEKLLSSVVGLPPEQGRKRLHAIFGPRIDWLGSGGAPLPPHVAHAFRDFGLLILQGYGLTESSPVISFNRKEAHRLESVGQAIPGVEVCIAADGEVVTRGPHVMQGYWNNPEATREAVRDGWLYTGDLGRLDDDGFLYITGRKKELLVLSSGKKVVPNQVESMMLRDPCIEQAVVHGEARSFLTALVVPHWANLARAMNLADVRPDDARATDFLLARMQSNLADLAPWERVKKIVLVPEPFSPARDEITVSLKLRRSVIFEHYRQPLEALYADQGK